MRNQTLKVDVFSFMHNAAFQEFQDGNLDLCLANIFEQKSEDLYKTVIKCSAKSRETERSVLIFVKKDHKTGSNDEMVRSVSKLNQKVFV